MLFEPRGQATGIGSMPFTDPGEALTLIKRFFPDIPYWPQLPLRGKQEHFVSQFLGPLLKTGLLIEDGDKAYFDPEIPEWADNLTKFYGAYLAAEEGDREALNEFAFSRDAAAGFFAFLDEYKKGTGGASFVKGQVVGPLSVSFHVKDKKGRFAYYDDQLRDLVVKTLAMHAAWQVRELASLGLPVIIFIDEPTAGVYGQSTYITVTREMIREDLSGIIKAAHDKGGLVGVHCCDAMDWSILFESDLDIVSFDSYSYFSSLVPFSFSLKDFVKRGGSLAWGAVPTLNNRTLVEDGDSLLKILKNQWSELSRRGISEEDLFRSCLVTPACGTGLLDQPQAERILQLTESVSRLLRTQGMI